MKKRILDNFWFLLVIQKLGGEEVVLKLGLANRKEALLPWKLRKKNGNEAKNFGGRT